MYGVEGLTPEMIPKHGLVFGQGLYLIGKPWGPSARFGDVECKPQRVISRHEHFSTEGPLVIVDLYQSVCKYCPHELVCALNGDIEVA